MTSGFGISGSTGRCYPPWMEFSECMRNTDDPRKCSELRNDYIECLHHRKEFTKMNAIYRERQRQLKQGIDVLAEDTPQTAGNPPHK